MKKILYVCDREKCKNCHPECKHTEDIRHAINFQRMGINNYVEQLNIQNALRLLSQVVKQTKKQEGQNGVQE